METAEPILTFITEIAELLLTFIADLAWPAVVLTIFLLVSHPIKALIGRIKKGRVKKGDLELTFDLMESFEALAQPAKEAPDVIPPADVTEEKPGIIPLADVTHGNLNWHTFVALADRYQTALLGFILAVPPDHALQFPHIIREVMARAEEVSSFLEIALIAKAWEPAAEQLARARARVARILDNPS